MDLQSIRRVNREVNIKDIYDLDFKEYGRVLRGLDFSEMIKYTEKNIHIPTVGNEYFSSVKELEEFNVVEDIKSLIYGGLDIQVGPCAGQNVALTGVEYHQGSEVVIAVKDCILILGKQQEIENNTYNSDKAEVFYLSKGEAVELYGTTLHYTPCKVDEEGFITIVILIKGTNDSIENCDNKILTKKNKYFITHSSQKDKIENGAYPGLLGSLINIKIK